MDWSRCRSRHCEPSGEAIQRIDFHWIASGFALAMTCRKITYLLAVLTMLSILTTCSISYKFEGGSINYEKTKTIHISEFPNRTASYPLLSQVFNLALRKRFIEQTRLREVTNNADIEIEGEIVSYQLSPQAVRENDLASKTRLTISIRVNYKNNKEANKDMDNTFSAMRDFDSAKPLEEVESQLVKEIVNEIVDIVYNSTVANW